MASMARRQRPDSRFNPHGKPDGQHHLKGSDFRAFGSTSLNAGRLVAGSRAPLGPISNPKAQ